MLSLLQWDPHWVWCCCHCRCCDCYGWL